MKLGQSRNFLIFLLDFVLIILKPSCTKTQNLSLWFFPVMCYFYFNHVKFWISSYINLSPNKRSLCYSPIELLSIEVTDIKYPSNWFIKRHNSVLIWKRSSQASERDLKLPMKCSFWNKSLDFDVGFHMYIMTETLSCRKLPELVAWIWCAEGIVIRCVTTLCLIPVHFNRSHIMRKPVFAICKQQRRRSACASAQSDQHLYCSLPR